MKTLAAIAVVFAAMAILGAGAVKPSSKVDFTEVEDSADDNGFVNVYKNYPKIQVTVDTSKLKRVSQPESDDSSSGSSGSSGSESIEQRTVGVRTDITIEISEESVNETNTVDGKIDTGKKSGSNGGKKGSKGGGEPEEDDDDNASVPVFKGMAGVPTTKGKTPKPTPPPNNGVQHGKGPEVTLGSRPPTFVHRTDERGPAAGPYDGWNRFQPVGLWTTERPYIRRIEYDYRGNPIYVKTYVPSYHTGHAQDPNGSGSWKPCYCDVYHHDQQPQHHHQPWDRAPSNPIVPTTRRRKVDDKIDVPYKQHRD